MRRIALCLLATACQLPHAQLNVASTKVDTLWYATARQRSVSRLGYRMADSLEYGYYRIASRANVDVMRAGLDIRVIDSARVTLAVFLASIAKPSRDSSDLVVLSVHGYATNHHKAINDAAEAYIRSGTRARWIAFSWPSRGKGVYWPTVGKWLASAYRDDSVAAVKSQPAFRNLLLAVHSTIGGNRLVVVTHSMGAQLATEALAEDALLRSRVVGQPLRAVGFFEPDVATARFEQHTLPLLQPVAQRVALYASDNDLMLRFSRLVNGGQRLGLVHGTPASGEGLESIDATNAISSESWWRRAFGTHHGMRRESGAVRDFFDIVVADAPPECRVTRGTALLESTGVWKLLAHEPSGAICRQ